MKEKIDREIIQKFTDKKLIEELRQVYGKNAIPMYLHKGMRAICLIVPFMGFIMKDWNK